MARNRLASPLHAVLAGAVTPAALVVTSAMVVAAALVVTAPAPPAAASTTPPAAAFTRPPAAAATTLHQLAAASGRFFGNAVDNGELTDGAYRPIINTEFGQLTPANAMKWDATEPQQGQFSYARGDEIVNLARSNGQSVRGHTLVWHSQTPGWVQNLDATAMRAAMRNHITALVTHYRGQLYAWDVVNEALNEDGSLRSSFWLQRLGPSYIGDAFRAARAADPNVKLYLNDYNVEGIGAKSDGMFALVQSLLQQGVPIDGVGLQAHLATQFGFPGGMQQNIQRFANLGLDVAITELDVRMPLPPDSTKISTQNTYYRNVTAACLAVARCVGITVWGFTDRYSWVPAAFPGQGYATLSDENLQLKPAYTAVASALGGGGSDTTPPTQPGTPAASGVTATSATLSWSPSTDTGGSGLAGYNVYREQGTTDPLLAQPTGPSVTLTGLTTGTQYQVYLRARDGAGNLSTPSPIGSFTTLPGGGPCRVAYTASNWGGANGFTATITITNTGTTTVDGWTLRFSFTAGQRLTEGWSATWSQPAGSAAVAATNLSWNAVLTPGGTATIGFNATHTGTNPPPTAFTLNGANCT